MTSKQIDEIASRLREYVNTLDGMEGVKLSAAQVKSIMAAEKIFASGQDVEAFEPEDIEEFINPKVITPHVNVPDHMQKTEYVLPSLKAAHVAFEEKARQEELIEMYGIHSFEIECPADRDCYIFSCKTPNNNRISAEIDSMQLHSWSHLGNKEKWRRAIITAVCHFASYLGKHPGV